MRERIRQGLLTALFFAPVSVPAVEVGEVAPAFTIASIDPLDPPITLSDYSGKVVYLDFWSSWCAPCRRVMPHLSALRDDLPRDRFEVVAVNVDAVDNDARRFLAQVKVDYPIGTDPTARSAASFGVATLPAAFLIDSDGVVQHIYRGSDAGDVPNICENVQRLISGSAQFQNTPTARGQRSCAVQKHALAAPKTSSGGGS